MRIVSTLSIIYFLTLSFLIGCGQQGYDIRALSPPSKSIKGKAVVEWRLANNYSVVKDNSSILLALKTENFQNRSM